MHLVLEACSWRATYDGMLHILQLSSQENEIGMGQLSSTAQALWVAPRCPCYRSRQAGG